MVRPRREKTKKSHIVIFGSIFLFILIFVTYKLADAVTLRPDNITIHTNVVYYDGQFSATNKVEDIYTALYVLNESSETVYATIFEYDQNHQEKVTAVQVMGGQNQYIKTDGPGVVYLRNADGTANSRIAFSKNTKWRKFIPAGFTF